MKTSEIDEAGTAAPDTPLAEMNSRPGTHAGPMVPQIGLLADWLHMLLVHFRVPAHTLAAHVPLPLDRYRGDAFVSLVFFTFERVRPLHTGALGRALFRPISDHPFLNVRTYVRGPAGPGIFFLREWISNPLSRLLGPTLYGLPYRLADFTSDETGVGGTAELRVHARAEDEELAIRYPSKRGPAGPAANESCAEHVLERYVAYTRYRGVTRHFRVVHPPWEVETLAWVRVNTDLLEAAFPWFDDAECIAAHRSDGFRDVLMGPPRRLAVETAGAPRRVREPETILAVKSF